MIAYDSFTLAQHLMLLSALIAVLFFATKNYAKDIDIHEVAAKGNALITFLKDFYPNVLAKIREEKQLSDELTAQLDEAIKAFLSK